MKRFFKFFAVAIFLTSQIGGESLFALPAVSRQIEDASGEYVFYRDNSFMRESYIGFLYYDESTYEARYFAPQTKTDSGEILPAKNLQILFSVNPASSHLELTGERFITPPLEEDTQIINYIHDLLYELTARRIKLGALDFTDYSKSKVDFLSEGKIVHDNYAQFGGNVTMIFDSIVPIFNLKKIVDYTGSDVFVICTIGRLASSQDKSFSEFVPPSAMKNSEEKKSDKKIKSAKVTQIEYTAQLNEKQNFRQEVSADKNWQTQSENMWTLGDSAFIFLSGFAFPQEIAQKGSDFVAAQILRRYTASNGYAYSDWNALGVFVDGEKIKINASTYNPKTGRNLTDIKTFGRAAENFYGCFSFSAFIEGYKKNRGYYDKIVKSYSFKIE